MALIDDIKTRYSNAVITQCAEQNCKLDLHGLNDYIILKGEKICIDKKICDCLLFHAKESTIIGTIELKSKTAYANEIIEKLKNGLEFAIKIMVECKCRSKNIKFIPVVLSRAWDSSEYKVLTNRKIEIQGKKRNIFPKRCGTSFLDLI